MNKEEFQNYLKTRYYDQIKWYSDRASKNKTLYYFFQWAVIILSASLPVLISLISKSYHLFTIILSILLAVGTAALKTFKFQEHWINYRTISETLKKEKYFYDANLDEYSDTSDKEALFVNRVESLISRENSLWVTTHIQQDKDNDNKKNK